MLHACNFYLFRNNQRDDQFTLAVVRSISPIKAREGKNAKPLDTSQQALTSKCEKSILLKNYNLVT